MNASTSPSVPPLLEFDGVSKQFSGNIVVDHVSFEVRNHEIVALLGQNGAGKSTLIKMLAGVHPLSGGEIRVKGKPVQSYRGDAPISFIHQDLGLIEWMTVGENLAMGMGFPRRFGFVDWRAANRAAEEALARVGGGISPRTRVFHLSRTERSLVAIARAIARKIDLLVLDEPTSSLPTSDVDHLFQVLATLRESGVGMIYVSHRLDEIFRISDRVVVMRDGKVVGSSATSDISSAEVVSMICGQKLSNLYPHVPAPERPDQVLVADRLEVDGCRATSFSLGQGELLGLTGLKGAGQNSVGRALFGLHPISSGTLTLNGRHPDLSTPGRAMAAGVGFLSSNRQTESVAMPLTVRENFFLNPGGPGRNPQRVILPREERKETAELVGRYDVRPADGERTLDTLSGGNQQKVALGRWLEFTGDVLILEEPTLGVDIGSKSEIYGLINASLRRGRAVIMLSTDFEEVAHLCHRALVFYHGGVVAELQGDDLTVHALVDHAAAGTGFAEGAPERG